MEDAPFQYDPTDVAAEEAAAVATGDRKKLFDKVARRYYGNTFTGWKALIASGRARVPEPEKD